MDRNLDTGKSAQALETKMLPNESFLVPIASPVHNSRWSQWSTNVGLELSVPLLSKTGAQNPQASSRNQTLCRKHRLVRFYKDLAER